MIYPSGSDPLGRPHVTTTLGFAAFLFTLLFSGSAWPYSTRSERAFLDRRPPAFGPGGGPPVRADSPRSARAC